MPNKRKQQSKEFPHNYTSLTTFGSFNKSQTRFIRNINTADLSLEEAETIHRLKKIHDIKKILEPKQTNRTVDKNDEKATKVDI